MTKTYWDKLKMIGTYLLPVGTRSGLSSPSLIAYSSYSPHDETNAEMSAFTSSMPVNAGGGSEKWSQSCAIRSVVTCSGECGV